MRPESYVVPEQRLLAQDRGRQALAEATAGKAAGRSAAPLFAQPYVCETRRRGNDVRKRAVTSQVNATPGYGEIVLREAETSAARNQS